MSYQGDDPNRPRERRRTETPRDQPRSGQSHQPQWQGQFQGTPTQQPPTQQPQTQQPPTQQPQTQQPPTQQSSTQPPQNQFAQGASGAPQTGGPRQSGEQGAGRQGGVRPGMQAAGGFQQQGAQPIQSGAQTGVQGEQLHASGQAGQFTQPAGTIQSPPTQPAGGIAGQRRPSKARLSPASLEEVISTDVVTAQRDTPIATVASMMKEHSVGCVIVVEDDGTTPIGVLTDRKIALAVETESEIGKRTAEQFVSADLLTGRTDMTVFEALDTLKQAGVRRLPIVDEDGALAGIVTLDDLLVLLGTNLDDAAAIIASQTTPRS